MARGAAINNSSYIGKHVLCDIKLHKNPSNDELIDFIEESIKESNMNIVNRKIKMFDGFQGDNNILDGVPDGMTALWILSESHFSVHTYPESKYITVDCYTCGTEGNPESAIKHLLNKLDVENNVTQLIQRGNI